MANRTLYQFQYAYEANPVDIFMKVNIGASGAPTLVTNQNKGIASIVRNSAGNYSVTLTDKFNRMLGFQRQTIVASGVPAAPSSYVVSETLSTTRIINFVCLNGATPTDPASGEVLLCHIIAKNSTI